MTASYYGDVTAAFHKINRITRKEHLKTPVMKLKLGNKSDRLFRLRATKSELWSLWQRADLRCGQMDPVPAVVQCKCGLCCWAVSFVSWMFPATKTQQRRSICLITIKSKNVTSDTYIFNPRVTSVFCINFLYSVILQQNSLTSRHSGTRTIQQALIY